MTLPREYRGEKPANVNAAVSDYIYMREQYDVAKDAMKRIKADLDSAERAMVECFLEHDTTSLQTQDLTVSIAQTCRVGITLGNTPAWIDWLRSRNLEPSDYLREEIIGKNLRETVREVLKVEGRLAIPETLPVDETPTARVRGWSAYMKNMGYDGVKDDDE